MIIDGMPKAYLCIIQDVNNSSVNPPQNIEKFTKIEPAKNNPMLSTNHWFLFIKLINNFMLKKLSIQ
ncbi:MAG: hypothetical protein QT09_C0001G0015 [archaeon GW2011_AR18]|nr:MAG: hypothetical protein QT09_C0001G0015 [archaeon GW2011_AR18]